MDRSDIVIIGGVAAGPKTAATLARRLPTASITLFQKEEHLSYATCGLPMFASGELGDFRELTTTPYGVVRDRGFFHNAKGFTAVTGAEVIEVDRTGNTVTVRMIKDGESAQHGYKKLVLATGAVPNRPTFPTPDSTLISSFTKPDHASHFRRLAEQGKVGEAVIIGGGFIGCELVGALRDLWGIEVSVIEQSDHLLPSVLDAEMASIVERHLRRRGVAVLTAAAVVAVETGVDKKPVINVNGRDPVRTDYVFLCLGVSPETTLARACGLEIGATGGIVVSRQLQTSDPDIYAGGDCIESPHRITGERVFMSMGSLANRHGRIIAENIAGGQEEFSGVLGAFVMKVEDINVGSVGLTQRAAQRAGFDSRAVWGTFPDRPDYHPDKQTFVLKLVYEAGSGRLLGLQGVGAGNVCRRIDVMSSFLQREAVLTDLLDFEHGYAPAYAEPLDPLYQMAGVAESQIRGVRYIDPGMDFAGLGEAVQLLDVREKEEAASKPLPEGIAQAGQRVINIPSGQLKNSLSEIDRSTRTIVVCQRGSRSYQAALMLREAGHESVEVLGGGLAALM